MRFGLAAWGLREPPLEKQLIMAKELGVSLLELGVGAWRDDLLQVDSGKGEIISNPDAGAEFRIILPL